MNTSVNFEIAKLLKEKGFDKNTSKNYVPIAKNGNLNDCDFKLSSIKLNEDDYSAPTIAEVVMWLYEKYRIWISVYTMDKWLSNGNDKKQLFDYSLKQMKLGLIDISKKPEEFDSPTEAYEAAIEYIIKNLI